MNIQVIVLTGLSGTGKSTLSDQLARDLGVPSFAGDWLLGALAPAHHVLAGLGRQQYLAMYHSLLESLITRQLMLDQGAPSTAPLPTPSHSGGRRSPRTTAPVSTSSNASAATKTNTADVSKSGNATSPAGTKSTGTTYNACAQNRRPSPCPI